MAAIVETIKLELKAMYESIIVGTRNQHKIKGYQATFEYSWMQKELVVEPNMPYGSINFDLWFLWSFTIME